MTGSEFSRVTARNVKIADYSPAEYYGSLLYHC